MEVVRDASSFERSDLGALAVGLFAAGIYVAGGGASPAAAAPTKITVTASEFKFAVSKTNVPPGTTVVFTVVNKGKIPHDFKIAGKKTKTLKAGQKTTLQVTFPKKGAIPFLCTLPGHAQGGMKGTFAVGPPPTKINVTASEFKFALSKKTAPAGTTVLFTVVNKGKIPHDFKIAGRKTKTLKAGQKTTLQVNFPKKGAISFLCTLPGHAQAGMKGKFGVGVAACDRRPTPTPTPPPTTTPTPTPAAPKRSRAIRLPVRVSSPQTAAPPAIHWRPQAQQATSDRTSTGETRSGQGAPFVQNGSTSGGISMPAFANMSQTDLNNIAAFVYASTH